jgi:hypothetical protein
MAPEDPFPVQPILCRCEILNFALAFLKSPGPALNSRVRIRTRDGYRHDYSVVELAVWAKRIDESGAKTAWVFSTTTGTVTP